MISRDILVHLKSHKDWSPHIDHAIGTARMFSSRLRALVTFHEVVMVAFRRSWFSEYMLGGTTRHSLKHITVPVLTGR